MALPYRRQPQHRPTQQPEILEFDQSGVLSDLVRTGEASRLRRRGAMRLGIDHVAGGSLNTNVDQPRRQGAQGTWDPAAGLRVRESLGPVVAESGSDEEYPGWQQRETEYNAAGNPTEVEASMSRGDYDKEEYDHILFCGGEEDDEDCVDSLSYDIPAWHPSPLPLFPSPFSNSKIPNRRPVYKPKRNNGCGAIIHMHASPRRRQGVWLAKTEAQDTVVSMDASYFDRKAVTKLLRSACGCVREGVGCAACGNTLGTRYKPCQAASEGLFNGRARHSTPPRPEGPRYWHAHTPSSLSSSYHVYTFFSANVISSPGYKFPSPFASRAHRQNAPPPPQPIPIPPPPPMLPMSVPWNMTMPMGSAYDPTFFDRVMTESPIPMARWDSEPGGAGPTTSAEPDRMPETSVRQRGYGGSREPRLGVRMGDEILDQDGVVIGVAGIVPTEPNSPDKLGEGLPLPEW